LQPDDLNEILKGCRKNNRAAQGTLYQWLAPKVLGVCMRYMEQRDEAEDVMQESFVKIFTNLGSFRDEGSFEGWARRIAANTALSALRKKKVMVFERNLNIVETIDFSEEETTTISLQEIMACLGSLPEGYRTIINLFLIEEFSHKQIAEKLNIQESTSRSQFARARQALMKLLKEKTMAISARNA
jgi:RNA polymerase sigma factor (sigma-70 family)